MFFSQFALTETIATSIVDTFPKKLQHKKWLVTLTTCIVMFLFGVNIVTQVLRFLLFYCFSKISLICYFSSGIELQIACNMT